MTIAYLKRMAEKFIRESIERNPFFGTDQIEGVRSFIKYLEEAAHDRNRT